MIWREWGWCVACGDRGVVDEEAMCEECRRGRDATEDAAQTAYEERGTCEACDRDVPVDDLGTGGGEIGGCEDAAACGECRGVSDAE